MAKAISISLTQTVTVPGVRLDLTTDEATLVHAVLGNTLAVLPEVSNILRALEGASPEVAARPSYHAIIDGKRYRIVGDLALRLV